MTHPPFYAKDCSVEAQTFLYCCAFWAVAADEELRPGEQSWLIEQFGEDGATGSLQEFVALESDEFFNAFDRAVLSLTDDDKKFVYPVLEEWLFSCASSDGGEVAEERDIIERIKKRLSLPVEVARLCAAPVVKEKELHVPVSGAASRDVIKAEEVRIFEGHTGEVMGVDVSSDGRYIVSCSDDGMVKLWDFAGGSEVRTLPGHEIGVMDVRFCPDGKRAVSGDRSGMLVLWNVESGEELWRQHVKRGGITGVDVSADGRRVAVSSDIGIIILLDLESGEKIRTFSDRKLGSARSVSFNENATLLLSGGDDKCVRLWDVETGVQSGCFEGHEDGVMSVCFSPDGKHVLSGSRDNTLKLWCLSTFKEEKTFKGHGFSVYDVSFSNDGKQVLSSSWDHTVKLWDVETGNVIFNMDSYEGRFSDSEFHPDGRHVVVGSSDKAVYVIRLNL